MTRKRRLTALFALLGRSQPESDPMYYVEGRSPQNGSHAYSYPIHLPPNMHVTKVQLGSQSWPIAEPFIAQRSKVYDLLLDESYAPVGVRERRIGR